MAYVKPKKRFGQHYLQDASIQQDIAEVFKKHHTAPAALEIGPGMGAITQYLWPELKDQLRLVELDTRCITYLEKNFEGIAPSLVQADFLQLDLGTFLEKPTSVIGNFPYYISSQIVFRILEHSSMVPLVVGMFQKEVADRLAGHPNNRTYGAISVLAQLHYDIEVVFDIGPEKFNPPPKVVSSVLVMRKKAQPITDIDETAFRKVVKAAFSTRRKQLRNALSGITAGREVPAEYATKRAENLSLDDFITLTNWWQGNG